MGRIYRVLFFHLVADGPFDFEKTLTDIGTKNPIATIGGRTIRSIDVVKKNGLWTGVVYRVRMDKDAIKTDIQSGKRTNMHLGSNEGLDEEVGFLFDIGTQCLGIQVSRIAPNAADFCGYLSHLSNTDIPLTPEIVLRKNGYKRFRDMKGYTRLEMRVASHKNPIVFEGEGNPSDKEGRAFIQFVREMKSPYFGIELSCGGFKNDQLNNGLIRRLVSAFKKKPDSFDKLQVGGYTNIGDKDIINFIEDRFEYKDSIDLISGMRDLTVNQRIALMRDAWGDSREQIRAILSEQS